MTYDAGRKQVLLFGGLTKPLGYQDSNETWTWDGVTWAQIAVAAPSPRHSAAMWYDSARGADVLFGGEHSNAPLWGDTWQFKENICKQDLNQDGLVNDADFTVFVQAYDLLVCDDALMPSGCPSDFQHDGRVDDLDFQMFIAAYDALVCP